MIARADRSMPPPLGPPPVRARTLVLVAAGFVLAAWLAVILVDSLDVAGTSEGRENYMFERLFHLRPVEWLQWLTLAALAVGAAYTAGRLTGTALHRERAFWFLIAVGGGLMLVEDGGNIRHSLTGEIEGYAGEEPLGIDIEVLVAVPYLAALAAVPIYALVRHGPVIWTYRPVRPYLATGFGLYAIAAVSNAVKHYQDLGSTLGEQLNRILAIERLPQPGRTEERFHFLLIDSIVEESVELLAVAALLASLLAFVATVSHTWRTQPEADELRR